MHVKEQIPLPDFLTIDEKLGQGQTKTVRQTFTPYTIIPCNICSYTIAYRRYEKTITLTLTNKPWEMMSMKHARLPCIPYNYYIH